MRVALLSPSDHQQTSFVQFQTAFVKCLRNLIEIDYFTDSEGSFNEIDFKIAKLKDLSDYDVLHFQWGNNPLHFFELFLLERLKYIGLQIPIISTLHEVDLQYLIKAHPESEVFSNYLLNNEEKELKNHLSEEKIIDYLPLVRIIKNSDVIIMHSKYAKERLQKELSFMALPTEKIKLAKLGTDSRQFAFKKEDALKEIDFNLPQDRLVFLYVGFLHEIKSVDLAIKALAQVKDKQSLNNFFFLIAGTGPDKDRLQKLAQSFIPGKFHFADFVSNLASYYSLADVVINPRAFSRGEVSGVIPEAFASGKPIIAPNKGCNNEYISNERGFLADENDVESYVKAITEFLKKPSEARKRGDAALEYSNKYLAWQAQAPFFIEQYNKTVKPSKNRKEKPNANKLFFFDQKYRALKSYSKLANKIKG